MPTRPFRVNAGTVCSYVLARPDRTHYLSELGQGHVVTAVRSNGATRSLVAGRTKTETRPLLLVKARSADGEDASVILQNDWHVRVLGPGPPCRHAGGGILPGAIRTPDGTPTRPRRRSAIRRFCQKNEMPRECEYL